MGNLILNGKLVENNVEHIADGDSLPGDGVITVSLQRWLDNKTDLQARGHVGVRLAGGDDLNLLGDLSGIALIAIEFEAFKDGRGYSHARLLRERHGFEGEIRAIGDVLRDQLFPMHRCGFNAFEIRADKNPEDALEGFNAFSSSYQPAVDEKMPLYRKVSR